MTNSDAGGRIAPSNFRPAKWLKNRHLQTIYPTLPWACRARPRLRREVLRLPDGDEIAIDWLVPDQQAPGQAPLLVVLHGLEGSSQSSYARSLMAESESRGWQCCVMHFRDCGNHRNRLPRRYHAGETNDLRFFLGQLEQREHIGPIVAAGFSLGGNVLLKYLGEATGTSPVRAAAAVSVPLNLHLCADALNTGYSMIYQYYLLDRMKRALRRKFNRDTAAFDWQAAMTAETFAEFDDAVTAPLHGFRGKDDYYDRCSSMHFLSAIARPTLIINATDDPFMTPGVIPGEKDLSASVTVERCEQGGHVGFIDGGTPLNPHFYVPGRVSAFLAPHLVLPEPGG
ncbi:MAG TPA: hydrolase [Woeseiaceae bacterium]|nr:hydrolase [Woeseiaceae bacterium]